MKTKTVLSLLVLLFLTGCTLVNVSLGPRTKPLEERVLEGEGDRKILIVDLDGTISFKEKRDLLRTRSGTSTVAFFREALRKAEADPDIVGVIVRINSPGGTVVASDAIHHEIVRFKQKRRVPVYAYILELGTSGGYYVACASDRIIAGPAAITGSIGVIAVKFNIEGLLAKIGVSDETYKSGPSKDFWLPFHPSTPEEKKMLQGIIDDLYGRFVEVVSQNRQDVLSRQEVNALADGRIFSASAALQAKLVDQVAYLDETIEVMKTALHISEAKVITYARPGTYTSNVYSEAPFQTPQVINLISINAEEFGLFSGVQFMYLWNP